MAANGTSISANVFNVTSSTTAVSILQPNTARLGASIYNDSTQILYLKCGPTASSTSYTVQIPASGYYELPYFYIGLVSGLWASANGSARVTEFIGA